MMLVYTIIQITLLALCIGANYGGFKANATPVIANPIARIYTKTSIDSIKKLYEPLMRIERYDDLVTKQQKVIELSLKIYEPNGLEIAEENHWMGYFLSQCKNYSEAIKYIQSSAKIYDSLGAEYIGEYFDMLGKIALYNYCNNDMVVALRAYSHILDEFNNKNAIIVERYVDALDMALKISLQYHLPVSLDKSLDFLSEDYIEDEIKLALYSNVISYYLENNNPNKAIEIFNSAEVITTRKPEYLTSEVWGDILLNVVNAYASIGDYEEAINKLGKAEAVYKCIGNPINDYYIYYSLGNIKHQQHQMQQAYDAYNQAIKILDNIEGMTLARANLLALQARCMLALNERDKASKLIDESIGLIDSQQQIASPEIIEIYDVYSKIAFNKGLYEDIIQRLNKVKVTYEMNDYFSDQINENIGLAYAKIGDYKNAVLIADGLISSLPDDSIFDNITKSEFESYLARVTTAGTIYSLSDRLSDAIHLLSHAYELCETHRFNSGEGYGALLNNLGLYNSYLGNFEDAKAFSELSLGFHQSARNKDYVHLFETLSNLFSISLQTKDEINIPHYAQLSYEMMNKIESVNFAEIESFMRNLLHYFVIVDDLERADTIGSYIQYESERLYGKDSKQYFHAISSLIYIYEAKQDWDSLISLAETILNNYDDDLHLRRAPIYYSLLNACMRKGDKKKTIDILKETYMHEATKVQMMASNFDSKERLYLLNDIQNYIISKSCSYVSENNLSSIERAAFLETIYNAVLLFKGLNLQIDKNTTKGINSLQIISVSDVQAQLSPKDCAIEFVEFDIDDNHEYGVLILTSNNCEFVKVSTESDLLKIPFYDRYDNLGYTRIVWGNILPYIEDKSTIYFSACGELHNIGIEYLSSLSKDGSISDQFDVYRLSSTRELLNKTQNEKSKDIALYGGMIYDKVPNVNYAYSRPSASQVNEDEDIEVLRGKNFKYLPATLREVNLIDSIFKAYDLNSTKMTGLNATESSIKSFANHFPSIIHIATHGIYWDKEAIEKDNKLSSLLRSEILFNKDNDEDYALSRSVLLFSGAQKFLAGEVNIDNGEDGILSALELSNLNLEVVDLVVLSACQTGLGDVKGDGVFGLQRGLKKAGANSILMSLWDVDDEATQILMTELYKNFLNGMSKRESLLVAQKAVRETSGFEDPEYWAAFILLDALN